MTYASTTTLAAIRAAKPCRAGWTKLLATLGKTTADDEPLDLLTVLDINGYDDAVWVLSYAMPDDRLARHFQAWCAEQVLHIFERAHPDDARIRDQITMLRNDDATDYDRAAARGAARDAASADASADAARGAAWAAAREAAMAAARAAARAAAWAAAWGAARDAQEQQLRKMIGARAS